MGHIGADRSRLALCATAVANGASVHKCNGADAGLGYRCDDLDYYAGARGFAEVATGCESSRAVPPGKRIALLLCGRLQPGKRVLSRFLRSIQISSRQHPWFCRTSGI